jgi:hypothetical protein
MEKIVDQITDKKQIIKISDDLVEIKTDMEIKKGIDVRIFVKKVNGKIYLTDNKHTLRYMNMVYELKASDVKQCINDVVNHYKFKIDKGEILTELKPNDNYVNKYNNLLVCSCTLANMLIFFDAPSHN